MLIFAKIITIVAILFIIVILFALCKVASINSRRDEAFYERKNSKLTK